LKKIRHQIRLENAKWLGKLAVKHFGDKRIKSNGRGLFDLPYRKSEVPNGTKAQREYVKAVVSAKTKPGKE